MSEPDPLLEADETLRRDAPALWAALSPLGRRARQPAAFLPLQTLEARGKELDATIGQITDGRGRAVPLPSMAAALAGLSPEDRDRAFLYSPVDGLPELRRLWRERQRRGLGGEGAPSSLPIVTLGPAHARALAVELFAGEGRTVVAAGPVPPGLRELVELRLGACLATLPPDAAGRFDPDALARRLGELPDGEPVVVVLAVPDRSFCDALAGAAARRTVVAVVDDAREPPGAPEPSPFWSLDRRAEGLVPVKVDGADGPLGFPGGGVGFLTFPFEPDSPAARAIESKVKMLLRAEVGSPAAAGQVVMMAALRG